MHQLLTVEIKKDHSESQKRACTYLNTLQVSCVLPFQNPPENQWTWVLLLPLKSMKNSSLFLYILLLSKWFSHLSKNLPPRIQNFLAEKSESPLFPFSFLPLFRSSLKTWTSLAPKIHHAESLLTQNVFSI